MTSEFQGSTNKVNNLDMEEEEEEKKEDKEME